MLYREQSNGGSSPASPCAPSQPTGPTMPDPTAAPPPFPGGPSMPPPPSLPQGLTACECSVCLGKREAPINSPDEFAGGMKGAITQPILLARGGRLGRRPGRWRVKNLGGELEKVLSPPGLVFRLGDQVRELLAIVMSGRRPVGGESPACSPQSQGGATGDPKKLGLAPSLSPPPSVRGAIYLPSKQRPPGQGHLFRGTSQD